MPWVTNAKLQSWQTAEGLADGDRPLASRVDDLIAELNTNHGGRLTAANEGAVRTALGVTLSELYTIAKWARAAGLLVQV